MRPAAADVADQLERPRAPRTPSTPSLVTLTLVPPANAAQQKAMEAANKARELGAITAAAQGTQNAVANAEAQAKAEARSIRAAAQEASAALRRRPVRPARRPAGWTAPLMACWVASYYWYPCPGQPASFVR